MYFCSETYVSHVTTFLYGSTKFIPTLSEIKFKNPQKHKPNPNVTTPNSTQTYNLNSQTQPSHNFQGPNIKCFSLIQPKNVPNALQKSIPHSSKSL